MKVDLDKMGMTCSQICGWHCIITPFIFMFFPYASIAFLKNELFEWGFITFSLIIASFALIQGFLVHKKWTSLALACIGFIIFIIMKIFFENIHQTFSGGLTFFVAGMMIFFAHYINHNACKKCCRH